MNPNAQKAITILRKLKKECGPASLAYFALPNVILTLSGARAYCDGVFWDDDQKGLLKTWNKEINESLVVLERISDIFLAKASITEARPGETYAGYELLTKDGLEYSLKNSKLVRHTPLESFLRLKSFEDIQGLVIDDLKNQDSLRDKTKEDLQHISFGFLLGYPDAAVLAVNPEPDADDPFRQSSVNANIRGSGYYICPQPDYFYPYSLYGNPEIVQNEQQWSNILIDYYTSDFHKELEEDLTFQAKLKELGSLQ